MGFHKNRQLGLCYLRIGEAPAAVHHLQIACKCGAANEDAEVRRLLAAAESTPGLELDREVNPTALRDASRPLWEAFEDRDNVLGATPRD